MWALSSLSLHGCQRSWEGLRLVTEQGKQLALNSERIASLYGVEGYRLAPDRYSYAPGANLLPLFIKFLCVGEEASGGLLYITIREQRSKIS